MLGGLRSGTGGVRFVYVEDARAKANNADGPFSTAAKNKSLLMQEAVFTMPGVAWLHLQQFGARQGMHRS